MFIFIYFPFSGYHSNPYVTSYTRDYPQKEPSFTGATRYRNLIDIVSSQLTTFLEALLYHLEKSDSLPYKGVNSKYILVQNNVLCNSKSYHF